jgi:hypothetical protein
MELGPGEPAAGPWRVERLDAFARSLADAGSGRTARPVVVAVDGRGGGGKTTLAERLCRLLPAAAVVHTDDVAWWHSRFGWDDLMVAGVLEPLLAGRGVRYRPPAWDARGRPGHISVPAAARVVLVEGVGASRRSLADRVDVAVWVQSDYREARRRGIDRDRSVRGLDEDVAQREWDEWEAEEVPFLLDDRPWERADVIAASTPVLAHDPDTEVALAPPARPRPNPGPTG